MKETALRLLRWTEKYIQTDMVYIASGGFWLGLGQFISSLSAFLTSIAFANLLLPETFGLYKYILSINSLLLITTLSGMDSAVTQSTARGFEGTLSPAVKEKMKWGVLGSVGLFVISLYYYLNGSNVLAIAFSVCAFFTPFIESFDMYNSLLWGKKLFGPQTKYNVAKKLVALSVIIATLFLTKNLYLILLAYFLGTLLPNIFFYERTKTNYQSNDNVDPDGVKYGKHLSVAYVISTILSELDKILLFHYVGAANLAVYSFATAPNDQIKGMFKNVNSLAMPKFSERTGEEIKSRIWHKVIIMTLIISSIVLCYILLSPYLFRIFFPKYLPSIFYSQLLSVSLIPAVIAGFLYTTLESQKAKKEIYKFNLYTNSLGIIVLFLFIYYFGILGAIISRIISRAFSCLYSIILLRRLPQSSQ